MLDFNPQTYTQDGVAVFATDANLLVKFFNHPEISLFESKERGVPVYKDVVMISVIQPGEKEEIKQLAQEWHRRRFPKQWENFQKGAEQQITGTPLDHLFPSEPSTILTLKSFNIFSVQQLAAITDSAMGNIPMGRQLVDRAKAYLHTSAQDRSEQERLAAQVAELTVQLAALQNPQAKQPELPKRRGPGRPPKAAQEGAA